MSKYTTIIPTQGPDGNVFVIIGTAMRLLRELGEAPTVVNDLRARAMEAKSYAEACDVVREFFPLEDDDRRPRAHDPRRAYAGDPGALRSRGAAGRLDRAAMAMAAVAPAVAEMRDDYDDHMEELSFRISGVLDGEKYFDAACACALMVAYALANDSRDDPERGRTDLAKVVAFITDQFEAIIHDGAN